MNLPAMTLPALTGVIAGVTTGIGAGIIAFDSVITGIGLAIAFGAGIGGVLFALATEKD